MILIFIIMLLTVVTAQQYIPLPPDCSTFKTESECNVVCECVWAPANATFIASNVTAEIYYDIAGNQTHYHCADPTPTLYNKSEFCQANRWFIIVLGLVIIAVCGLGIIACVLASMGFCGYACFVYVGRCIPAICAKRRKYRGKKDYSEIPMNTVCDSRDVRQ